MLRGREGLAVGTGESEKTARCDSTTAAANGQCSLHATGRWRTPLERLLRSAETDTCLRARRSQVQAVGALIQRWRHRETCADTDIDRDRHCAKAPLTLHVCPLCVCSLGTVRK